MNKLTTAKRVAVVGALVEGMSINATCRMTGVSKPTVLKLLADLGKACNDYQDAHLINLTSRRVQCDEIWSFVYSRRKNVPFDKRGEFGYGDVWTFTAIDADSKLVLSYFVGRRDAQSATYFMRNEPKLENFTSFWEILMDFTAGFRRWMRAYLPEILIVLGVALFIYGASVQFGRAITGRSWEAHVRSIEYSRLEMTVGAAMIAAGLLLRRKPKR